MVKAIGARRDGDAFQARIFWIKAASLLDGAGRIARVGFEHGPQGFDDIWVEYEKNRRPQDQLGCPIDIERFQCKWHVAPGQITYSSLVQPEYIGAKTSLLQRAYSASSNDATKGLNSLVRLTTNHTIDHNDTLCFLIRNRSHTLNLDLLFDDSTDRSAVGKVRKLWREHLGIDNDALKFICSKFGLDPVIESLEGVKELLDEKLRVNGLLRLEDGLSTRYDDIPFQWASQGRNVFDRKSFREACESERLFAEVEMPKRTEMFGIKSFQHSFDSIEDRCKETLDLTGQFDDRFIREPEAWNLTLLPELNKFITSAVKNASEQRIRLALDVHSTLAFATGAVLNTKSGRIVEIEQRSPHPIVWSPDDRPIDPNWPEWDIKIEPLPGGGRDIVVGIALTQPLETKVREYQKMHIPQASTLVVAVPAGGPSQRSVVCGAHAERLAEKLAMQLKTVRDQIPGTVPSVIHLFISAPNGFAFYFGRYIESIKPLILYEFDFQSQRNRSYMPSLQLAT